MKNKILPVIAAVVIAAAVVTVIFVPKGGKQTNTQTSTQTNRTAAKVEPTAQSTSQSTAETAATVNENGDIEIKLEDLATDSAAFLSYNLDGTEMGLLAIRDDAGNIYTAFNTCQVCNGSPRAYFEQKNGRLVCQNCGNQFALSSIGSSAMGCNPITITDKYVTKTDKGIVIIKEFLEANKELFTNWKKL